MAFVDGATSFITGPFGVAFLTMLTVLSAVALYVWCRRRCCKLPVNYTAVNHGLDEEEMAFKRTMETQHADDIDELFNFSGQDELEFDRNDLDNLEMLQVRRSNLTGAPAKEILGPETGLGKDDLNGTGGIPPAGNGDIGQEVEDLEALLDGSYLEDGGGGGAARGVDGQSRRNGTGSGFKDGSSSNSITDFLPPV